MDGALIKFRAWNKKDNQMIDWLTMVQSAFNSGNSRLLYLCLTGFCDLVPLQYAGLKDKNGKEFYTADVIDWDGIKFKVCFGPYEYAFDSECPVESFSGFYLERIGQYDIQPLGRISSESTVIGNIYENPELLES